MCRVSAENVYMHIATYVAMYIDMYLRCVIMIESKSSWDANKPQSCEINGSLNENKV